MRIAALLLTVLSGFAALVYEIVWQKYVATLLGSHSEATAIVLGVFLAGLSAGYAVFGRLTRRLVAYSRRKRRPPRLFFAYGVVELAIGAYALTFPALFALVRSVSYAIPHGSAGLGLAFDALLVAVLLTPPTMLMGGTIPILTQALARSVDDSTRVHALVYGWNTVGAFAGALAAGFALIPWLGFVDSLRLTSTLNLAVGAVFVAWGFTSAEEVDQNTPARTPGRMRVGWVYSGIAFLWGFSLMVVQNVSIRVASLALGASEFTFAIVVAVVVLSIAFGSLVVSSLPRVPRAALFGNQVALAASLALLYWPMERWTYWGHLLRIQFGNADADFLLFHLSSFGALLLILGVPGALAGATLPLLFDHLRHRFGDLGALAGSIYSWNTLGALAGAIFGGYALLFVLDLHHVYRLAVFASVLVAVMLWPRAEPGVLRKGPWAVLGIAALVITGMPPWAPEYLSLGLFRERGDTPQLARGIDAAVEEKFARGGRRIVFYEDGPVASVAVVESPLPRGGVSRAVLSNGKSDGSTGADYPTMALAGLIPALLSPTAERAFVIGYGTGVTVGELSSLESMKEVTTAEISSAVLAAAPLFDFANQHASRSRKAMVIRGDAYRAMMRSSGGFDIIVSEPSNPWVTGVEMLFSREFLLAARRRLTPQGV
jgi:predicted membrane-bound spermidine synthase